MAQFIGVHFMNKGPYSPNNSIEYNFYTSIKLIEGDVVVVHTQYGPAVAQVTSLGACVGVGVGTKGVIERLTSDWAIEQRNTYLAEKERKVREKDIKELKAKLKRELNILMNNPIKLASFLLCKNPGPQHTLLTDILRELETYGALEEESEDLPF